MGWADVMFEFEFIYLFSQAAGGASLYSTYRAAVRDGNAVVLRGKVRDRMEEVFLQNVCVFGR